MGVTKLYFSGKIFWVLKILQYSICLLFIITQVLTLKVLYDSYLVLKYVQILNWTVSDFILICLQLVLNPV